MSTGYWFLLDGFGGGTVVEGNQPPAAAVRIEVIYIPGASTIRVTDLSTDDLAVASATVTLYDGNPNGGGVILSGPTAMTVGGQHDFTPLLDGNYWVRQVVLDGPGLSSTTDRFVRVAAALVKRGLRDLTKLTSISQ